jgi:hypothetical protein
MGHIKKVFKDRNSNWIGLIWFMFGNVAGPYGSNE